MSKAEEYIEAARASYQAGRYNACGLEAVHAGISAADAVTVVKDSSVSAGAGHAQVVGLLRAVFEGELPTKHDHQLAGLLALKNDVEYSSRIVTSTEAKAMLDQATRFVVWSRSIVDGEFN